MQTHPHSEEGDRLREAVERAISELRAAQERVHSAQDIDGDTAVSSDGILALRRATKQHADALAKLRTAVREFEEFMAHRWAAPRH